MNFVDRNVRNERFPLKFQSRISRAITRSRKNQIYEQYVTPCRTMKTSLPEIGKYRYTLKMLFLVERRFRFRDHTPHMREFYQIQISTSHWRDGRWFGTRVYLRYIRIIRLAVIVHPVSVISVTARVERIACTNARTPVVFWCDNSAAQSSASYDLISRFKRSACRVKHEGTDRGNPRKSHRRSPIAKSFRCARCRVRWTPLVYYTRLV